MKKRFTTFEIAQCLGISREKLKDWQNNKFITPTVLAKGKGTKAEFTLLDVYSLALFKHLVEQLHLKREVASKFASSWKSTIKKSTKNATLDDLYKLEKKTSTILSNEVIFLVVKGKPFLAEIPLSANEDRHRDTTHHLSRIMGSHIWDDILIVNFLEIKNKVDDALQTV